MSEMSATAHSHGDAGDFAHHGGGVPTVDVDARGFEPVIEQFRKPALIAAGAGWLLMLIGIFVSGWKQWFHSYLYGYLFWLGLTLGPMAVVMIQHLSGGQWGLLTRRIGEACSRQLPLMAILFIPLMFSVSTVYIWADPSEHYHEHRLATAQHEANEAGGGNATSDAVPETDRTEKQNLPRGQVHPNSLTFKTAWLNPTNWRLRTGIYFCAWLLLCWLLNSWSARQDAAPDALLTRRMSLISGPGLRLYVITMTGAAIDWVGTLDPDWYSTMYGVIFVIGQAVSTFSFFAIILHLLKNTTPLNALANRERFHDIGNFMLAFIMFLTYVNFSQFLIIWSGNISDETPYYVYRTQHGWRYLGISLALFHFAVPFMLLLWRRTKKNSNYLWKLAAWVLFMRFVDLKFITGPSMIEPLVRWRINAQSPPAFTMSWLDIVAPFAIGGLWMLSFVWNMKRRPLLPRNDPRLIPALENAAHAH